MSELVTTRPDGTPVYAVACPDCGAMVTDSPDGWDRHDHTDEVTDR